MGDNTIKWVRGNTLPLVVTLHEIEVTKESSERKEYTPPEGSIVTACIVGSYKTYAYEVAVEGSLVYFTDDGTLPIGTYGIEIKVKEEERNLRSFKCGTLQIVNCDKDFEVGDLLTDEAVALDAFPFIFGKGEKGDKGDKGDAGTTNYEDLENKPDLSVYMEKITQEEFNQIFT